MIRRASRRAIIQMVGKGGWSRPFDDPIPLPRGRQLITLEDAADYITRLPKAEHESQEWQAAIEALIMAEGSRAADARADRTAAGADRSPDACRDARTCRFERTAGSHAAKLDRPRKRCRSW
jgi:hypothetical protein